MFKKWKNCNFCKGVNPCFWSKIGHFSIFLFLSIIGSKLRLTIFQNEKTPFQATKTRSSKSRRIEIFPKGLTHGFGPKLAIFLSFFQALQVRKMCFTIFQNAKKRLSTLLKNASSKSGKIEILGKGLTLGFGPKLAISQCFFRQYRPEKCVLRYSRTKKRLSRL